MITKLSVCNKVASINSLKDHMFIETENIFKGTVHEDDWVVYHDALSLFTANDSVEYMRNKGYLDHLILPQNGCNQGTAYAD